MWLFQAAQADEPAAKPAIADAPSAVEIKEWEKLEAVPSRFPRVTDKFGCRWGLNHDGDIGLSNVADQRIGAFERGAVLMIDGKEFNAAEAESNDALPAYQLRGKSGELEIARHIWLDHERGGARFIDTVKNPGSAAKAVKLEVRTDFGDGVEAISRLDGRTWTGPDLGGDNAGLLVTQDAESQKAAVLFLLAQPRAEPRPVFKVEDRDGNSKARHVAMWEVTVPAGKSISVLYWLLQRPGLTPDQAKGVAEAFVRGSRLIRPRMPPDLAETVVNFSLKDASESEAPAADALLGGLRRLCERLGIERGEEDVYWMSANSLLSGQAQGEPVTVESRFGTMTIPLPEIAAVQGGAGRGRLPRVFLRDGTVLTGPLSLPGWKMGGAKGWSINLTAEAIEAIVLKTSPDDGVVSPPPAFLAALNSGEVLPLQLTDAETLALTSPWGPVEASMNQIVAFYHLKAPATACRLWLSDGSKLTVFPTQREFTARSPRLGTVTLNIADLAVFSQPAKELPDFSAEPEEIPDLEACKGDFCLLKGGNLVAGVIAHESLTLVSGATQTVFTPADLRLLRRIEGGTDSAPVFHLALTSGGQFDGLLPIPSLKIKTATGNWEVPVAHIMAVKRETQQ